MGALRRNFDAEFLGINPEEVNVLRDETEKLLDKVNLVPIRPSILTLLCKIFYQKFNLSLGDRCRSCNCKTHFLCNFSAEIVRD